MTPVGGLLRLRTDDALVLGVVDRARLVDEHHRDAVGVDAVGDMQPRVVELVAGVDQRTVVLRAGQAFAHDRVDGLSACRHPDQPRALRVEDPLQSSFSATVLVYLR